MVSTVMNSSLDDALAVDEQVVGLEVAVEDPAGNCIKIGLPGKWILGDYFQEKRSSGSPILLK